MENNTTEMLADPNYQKFVDDLAKQCRCCPECYDTPCDGLLSGGVCDESQCHCEDFGED